MSRCLTYDRPRKPSKKRDEGFSLIEVMVVMVIIGIMTATAVALIPSGDNATVNAARKTAVIMEKLHREAVITGKTVGVSFIGGTLDIRTLDHDGWQKKEISFADELNPFLSRAEIEVSAGLRYSREPRQVSDDQRQRYLPAIWFLPTGEYLEFSIRSNDPTVPVSVIGRAGLPIAFEAGDSKGVSS